MACKTIADLIPESYLKFPKIADLIKKIPKIPGIKKKNWKIKVPMQKAIAFLSNPANQALIKTVMDIKNLGDLANLTTLMNIARFAQVNGMVDLSKLQGAAKNAMDALDCINKNIAAVENISGQLQSELQQLLNTGTALQAVGLDQVLGQLGITDIMGVTPALQEQLNSVLKFQKLTEIPGVGTTLPLPWDAPKYQQSLYILNSMATMIQTVDRGERDPNVGKALETTSQVAGVYSAYAESISGTTTPLATKSGVSSLAFPANDPEIAKVASAAGGLTPEVLASAREKLSSVEGGTGSGTVPLPLPAVLPSLTREDGTKTPVAQQTAEALVKEGEDGLTQIAASFTQAPFGQASIQDRVKWKERQLNLLRQRYTADYDYYAKALDSLLTPFKKLPVGDIAQDDLVLLSKYFGLRKVEPLEDYRISDYKLKAVILELSELSEEDELVKDGSKQFDEWASAALLLGGKETPPNFPPPLGSEWKEAGNIPVEASCNWTHLKSVEVGGKTVQVTFDPGADRLVKFELRTWFENFVTTLAGDMDLKRINISSTLRPKTSSFSWHAYGSALDINWINNVHIGRSDDHLSGVSVRAQNAANASGVHENYGPAGLLKAGGRVTNTRLQEGHQDHLHLSVRTKLNC